MTDVFSAPMHLSRHLSEAAAAAAHELGVFDALPAPDAVLADRLGLRHGLGTAAGGGDRDSGGRSALID